MSARTTLGRPRREGLLDRARFHARVDAGVDYAALHADPRLFAFIVCDLRTGEVSVRGNRTETTPESLRAVAHGAFALPPLLPPVPLGRELLVDGGLLHNAPLDVALELGAREIVYLCNVRALPASDFHGGSALAHAARYAEVFFRRASNIGFAGADVVEERYRGVPLLVIAPPATLRFEAILRHMLPTVNAMDHLAAQGRASAKAALARWLASSRSQTAARGGGAVRVGRDRVAFRAALDAP